MVQTKIIKQVRVNWIDSLGDGGWNVLDNLDDYDGKPTKVLSLGFLIKETDEYICLAQSLGVKPQQVCHVITIPKCCVKDITEIKY